MRRCVSKGWGQRDLTAVLVVLNDCWQLRLEQLAERSTVVVCLGGYNVCTSV